MKTNHSLAALLEAFFTDRLMKQKLASSHTIASYRDTFQLLLKYAQHKFKKCPSKIELRDLNASFICDFLNYLEKERGNIARTRNTRLAAIRSFFHYIAYQKPEHADLIQHVLGIPTKRWQRPLIDFLSKIEIDALLNLPMDKPASNSRDCILLLFAIQTGLRVSELITLKVKDITLGIVANVRCMGKGRKERCVPISKETSNILHAWLQERNATPDDPLFPNARGKHLSPDGVEYILKKHVNIAQNKCDSLRKKRISPHVLRHTTAVNLLQAGVDQSVIALWLGHESVETTQVYLDADLAYKEKILMKMAPINTPSRVYHPDDKIMAFLKNL